MTITNLDAVAEALLKARQQTGLSAAAPLAAALHGADDAYLVQGLTAHELGWFGDAPARHWKSGGASRTAVLTHAPLPPQGVWASPANASAWPFRLRFIEAEIALRLGSDVTPEIAAQLNHDSAPALIDAMAVAIEIVDSRWDQGFDAPAWLRLADLQSHGALVLGEWGSFAAKDWSAQTGSVTIGVKPALEFRGSHSCGDPAWVLVDWLQHATRDGATVAAGSVVTTGTWCGALEAAAGDTVTVRFEGVGEARVQL